MPGRIAMKRAQLRAQDETRPGQVLLLAILGAAPFALAFVLLPAFTGMTNVWLIRVALIGSPIAIAFSVRTWARMPPELRSHGAARIGIVLDVTSAVLWLLVLIPALMGRV